MRNSETAQPDTGLDTKQDNVENSKFGDPKEGVGIEDVNKHTEPLVKEAKNLTETVKNDFASGLTPLREAVSYFYADLPPWGMGDIDQKIRDWSEEFKWATHHMDLFDEKVKKINSGEVNISTYHQAKEACKESEELAIQLSYYRRKLEEIAQDLVRYKITKANILENPRTEFAEHIDHVIGLIEKQTPTFASSEIKMKKSTTLWKEVTDSMRVNLGLRE